MSDPRWPERGGDGGSLGERLTLAVLLALLAAGLLVWLVGGLAGLLFGGGWPPVAPADVAGVLLRLPGHLDQPRQAWPAQERGGLPGPVGFAAAAAVVVAGIAGPGVAVWHGVSRGRGRARGAAAGGSRGAAWAHRADLRPLLVPAPQPGRVTLGRVGRRLIAAEPRQSVLIVAPTQSLKTTGLAIPAILEWDGPVLATSVKTDLLNDTLGARQARGQTFVYDPAACTSVPSSAWSPLEGCRDWQGAQRTAAWLCAAAQPGGRGGLADADFWYAAAGKLLAPVLHAAALSGGAMAEVVRWVDTQEREAVADVLLDAGAEDALIAAQATWGRDDRQRSSIYTTAETVLAAYADPGVLASAYAPDLTPDRLLDGGAHTAYLCAPAHEQQRLRPLFATLVQQLLATVYERASRTGQSLDPPLLVVLDEAANVAPLRDLDTLAATAAGQGIQLVSVFQDLAQVRERWGARAATIVNNHRAKILGPGLADPETLEFAARVLGDEEVRQVSATEGREGHGSTTESTTYRALTPAHVLRQAEPGTGVLIYGNLPPALLHLRPWFADRGLRRLANPTDVQQAR